MAPKSVHRTVSFYKILSFEDGENMQFDTAALAEALGSHPDKERYFQIPSGGPLLVSWVEDKGVDLPHVTIATKKKTDLPPAEKDGNRRALNLSEDEGLLYTCFCGFFPDGVVGILSGAYAPTAALVAKYLRKKVPGFEGLNLHPFVAKDAHQELSQHDEITMLSFTISTSDAGFLAEHDESLAQALSAAGENYGAQVLEVSLKLAPYSRDGSLQREKALELANVLGTRAKQGKNVTSLRSKARGMDVPMNLLSSVLTESVDVAIQTASRTPDLDVAAAYQALEEAYEKVKRSLQAGRFMWLD